MNKHQIWILSLEPLETRYTAQGAKHLPMQLKKVLGDNFDVYQVVGELVSAKPTPGAFLDFAATNIWKSTQLADFMRLVQVGRVKKNDYVLVTDAWNTSVLQIKYTSDLMGLDLRIGAIWHAGSYDRNDFLGRACGDKKWTNHTEEALLNAIDDNFFATDTHINLISETYTVPNPIRTGFPFEYFHETFEPYTNLEKENIILFPHRLAPEKLQHVFDALSWRLPEYDWIVCQEKELSKDEYHTLLGKSKIVFSANLQETLGISMLEALMCNSFPLMPNRLTYPEMYDDCFLYPSEWADEDNLDLESLMTRIIKIMNTWETNDQYIRDQIYHAREQVKNKFLTADTLYNTIRNHFR